MFGSWTNHHSQNYEKQWLAKPMSHASLPEPDKISSLALHWSTNARQVLQTGWKREPCMKSPWVLESLLQTEVSAMLWALYEWEIQLRYSHCIFCRILLLQLVLSYQIQDDQWLKGSEKVRKNGVYNCPSCGIFISFSFFMSPVFSRTHGKIFLLDEILMSRFWKEN